MSKSVKKTTTYFDQRGVSNTEEVCRIVADRVKEGDIEAVCVATSTGSTALAMAKAVSRAVPVYAVNFQKATWDKHSAPDPANQKQAEELGAVFMPDEPTANYVREVPGHSADSLRLLGQGMKVAVEVVMQSVDVGHIKAGARVIGVGGSSRGADVAIVAKAAGSNELSRLWVGEILAKVI